MTVNREIIRLEKLVGIKKLTLLNRINMILSNIAYTLRCNSNLIYLSQLKNVKILYYNYLKRIILKTTRNIISIKVLKK